MIEVPDYLLERSKERRLLLSGESAPETAEIAETTSETTPDKTTSGETSSPPTTKILVPISPSKPALEIPIPKSVELATSRLKIPYWVMPILLFLPVWAFIYVGTLETPAQAATGILADGARVYTDVAACSTCHGPVGSGTSAGPPLSELLAVFPDTVDGIALHIEWVIKATEGIGVGRPYGDPKAGRVAGWFGTMPSFDKNLTARQLLEVVLYERAVLSEDDNSRTIALRIEEALKQGTLVLPEKWSSDVTAGQILNDIQAGLTSLDPES